MSALLVDVGDLHCGSSVGLLPGGGAEGEDGERIMPSALQRWMWDCWISFWNEVRALKPEYDRVIGILGGDLVDGDRPNGVQRWTQSRAHQAACALECLEEAHGVVDDWFVCVGTPFHSGWGGQAEREIARALGAQKYRGQPVALRLLLLVEDVLVEVSHPSRIALYPWTRGGPAVRLAAQILAESAESGSRVPDLVIVHHGHRVHDSGVNFRRPRVIVAPGWQPITEYAHHRQARAPVPVGGVICNIRDGALEVAVRMYWPKKEQAVRVC